MYTHRMGTYVCWVKAFGRNRLLYLSAVTVMRLDTRITIIIQRWDSYFLKVTRYLLHITKCNSLQLHITQEIK